MSTLHLPLDAYGMARSLGIDGAYSRLVFACCGITAGSGFATTELRILLLDVVISTMRVWPLVAITFYVDDITIESESLSERVAVATNAAATDHVISQLQDCLDLDVSAKKSLVVAGKPSMTAKIALGSPSKKVSAVSRAKLLGTTSGGGRRRAAKFLAVRRTAFSKRKPRIHMLRRTGFSATRLTRAAGTPVLTYGTETYSMSPSHLLSARRLEAISPRGSGRIPDMVLHVADAGGGTVDPAFDAY
jgi:hypothetical protein